MSWVLFLITMSSPTQADVQVVNYYKEMDDCFVAHDILVENIGRPIVNYRPVCLQLGVEI